MAIPTIGDNYLDAELIDLNDEKHTLSAFNDKFMLLSFWSMSCMICMKAAKHLKPIHESYADKLTIVSINMDTDKVKWEMGTSRDKITWTNLSDGLGSAGGIGQAYGVFGFPAYVLINKDGVIIDRWMGYKAGRFEEKMNEHLSN